MAEVFKELREVSCPNCKRLGKVIQQSQETLKSRNKEIDLLLKVWCTGGCDAGVGRWSDEEIKLEDVEYVEDLARRLRSYYRSRQFRLEQRNELGN